MYSGYNIIWANDFDKDAVKTYASNISSKIVEGDITEIYKEIPKSDVLIGGFPCQPFSMMGKQKGFPSDWKFVVSDTQSYREFGNAVLVNVSYAVAQSINKFLREKGYIG